MSDKSSKRPRRSISLSGDTYNRLTLYCETNGKTRSGVVEEILQSLLKNVEVKNETAPIKEPLKIVEPVVEEEKEEIEESPEMKKASRYFTF
jgi:hypothetical protein